MTERDKIRICKGILKSLANIDINSKDIKITSFRYNTTNRDGFKQYHLGEVEFNNGSLEFLLLNHVSMFTIKNLDDYPCEENTIRLKTYNSNYHFNVVEKTNYIDGKPHYITQLFLTVCYHDKEPTVTQIF